MVNRKSYRIPALDGWRAIAILMVITAHIRHGLHPTEAGLAQDLIFYYGNNGVDIFFAISGLLITKLLLEEFDREGSISLRAFYVRRCFRILPLVLVFLSFVGSLGWFTGPLDWIAPLFFFRMHAGHSFFTMHFWTLGIEEHFYLLWPALLGFSLQRRKVFQTIIFAVGAGEIFYYVQFHAHIPLLTFLAKEARIIGMLWAAGAAIALHYYGEVLRRYFHWAIMLSMSIAFVLGLRGYIHLPAAFSGCFYASLILFPICQQDGMLAKFLELSLLRWIGRISYSLYVWQQIFLLQGWLPHPWGWVQYFPQNIVAAFAIATLSYYFLEQPMIRIGKRFAGRIKKQPSATTLTSISHSHATS